MPVLEDPQHEAFAQARFAGKSLIEAHTAAGYAGDKAAAFQLNQLFEVKERIAELYREAASQTIYEKSHAIRDLLAIVHACAADAGADHPLCEPRLGKDGLYYRFPAKLQAMARLIKLMDWDQPVNLPRTVIFKRSPASASGEAVHGLGECHDHPADSSEAKPATAAVDTPPSDPICPTCPISPIPNDAAPDPTLEPDPTPDPIANNANKANHANHANHANNVLTSRQQSFANGRVKGLGVMAAYHAAGYTGNSPNLAWRLNSMPAIKARIAQLNGGVEAATGYRKDDAIRDLAAIIHAHPAHAGPDHPLSEQRMNSWGSYHRFPSKLTAIALLMKMLGWNDSAHTQEPLIVTLQSWLSRALPSA